jgi:hypothetical protein
VDVWRAADIALVDGRLRQHVDGPSRQVAKLRNIGIGEPAPVQPWGNRGRGRAVLRRVEMSGGRVVRGTWW